MLAVVKQPHTNKEVLRIEGTISNGLLQYVNTTYGKENVSFWNNHGEELLDPFDMDWYKDAKKGIKDNPGIKLSTYRWNSGLTQKELAEKSGVARESISQIERGKRPIGINVARKLAPALEISYKDLL